MIRIVPGIQRADLQESLKILDEATTRFMKKADICGRCSGLPDVAGWLTADRLNQFLAMSKAIVYPLDGINFNMVKTTGLDNIAPIDEQARITQSWICLGSIIESAMKIWLAIYYFDFTNSAWRTWSINETVVLAEIDQAVNNLVQRNELDNGQEQSLKATIREALSRRRSVPDLDKFDFLEMLRFFKKEVNWEQDTIDYINKIRCYRNSIHAFTPRTVGYWNELLEALRFTCALIFEMSACTPDCSDLEPLVIELERYYNTLI